MKTKHWPIFLILSFLIPVIPLQASEAQEWEDSQGRTMTAVVVEVRGDTVVFSRDGQEYNFPIGELSQASQARIRNWEKERLAKEREAVEWSQVYQQLSRNLVEPSGSRTRRFDDSPLAEKRYFVFYYTASWCPPCRNFTPDLVRFYQNISNQYDTVAFVIASADDSDADMVSYMRDSRMPWPAVTKQRRSRIPIIDQNATRGIPGLVLVNGKGEVLASSANTSRNQVMAQIESVLKN